MESPIVILLLLFRIIQCQGVSWRRQLEHIAKTRLENEGLLYSSPSRRFYEYDPRELSSIIGVPSSPSHLPEAEPILPGHTLLRPALGMLKSALKFPHRELEDGAGVYGNVDNLGLKYDSRNERLLYSGFRRSPSDYIMVIPAPSQVKIEKPRFKLKSAVLDLDSQAKAKNEILKILKKLSIPARKGVKVFIATENGKYLENLKRPSGKASHYLSGQPLEIVTDNSYKDTLRTNQNIAEISSAGERGRASLTGNELHLEDKTKKDLWLNSKDTFDHIKIIQEAPELNELGPKYDDDDKIRKWWFYNQVDYQPFSREQQR